MYSTRRTTSDRPPSKNSATVSPQQMLLLAKAGNSGARAQMFHLVYKRGQEYFSRKVSSERILDRHEAADLAGESILEFQKSWMKVRCLDNYTRRMFKNNLIRFLTRKRRRSRKEPFHSEAGILNVDTLESNAGNRQKGDGLEDIQVRQLALTERRIKESDNLTKAILTHRLAAEPLTYRQIEGITGISEAAMRMRFARFCHSVRLDFDLQEGLGTRQNLN